MGGQETTTYLLVRVVGVVLGAGGVLDEEVDGKIPVGTDRDQGFFLYIYAHKIVTRVFTLIHTAKQ